MADCMGLTITLEKETSRLWCCYREARAAYFSSSPRECSYVPCNPPYPEPESDLYQTTHLLEYHSRLPGITDKLPINHHKP